MKTKTLPPSCFITDHLDTWTSAVKAKSSAGRGGGKKQEFYGIKKLRELILELAVRGLLVAQDANDEPATVFLKKVEVAKAKLIKDGQIKKPTALPNVTEDEEPFQLPVGWKWARLNELASVIRGVTYKKSDASDIESSESVALMRANNIGKGLNFDNLLHIPRKLVNSDQLIIKGDLLIAMSSGSPTLVGKAAQANDDLYFSFGAFCAVIRAYSPALFEYFRIFFETPCYRSQTQQIGKGIGIQNLNKGELESLLIPVPTAFAMTSLVAKVDELMALCDQLEQQQEDSVRTHASLVETLLGGLTAASERGAFAEAWQRIASHFDTLFTTESSFDQLKQTILQLAVMGKLVPQDRIDEPAKETLARIAATKARLQKAGEIGKEKPVDPLQAECLAFEVPKAWQWAKLAEITELITKGSSPKWQGVTYVPESEGILFITSENVGNYVIRKLDDLKYVSKGFNEIEPRSILKRGDILMNLVGASIGRAAVYDLHDGANINQAVALIRLVREVDGVAPRFLLHYLNSPSAINYMLSSRVVNAQPNISLTDVREFPVPIPPLAEQHRIVAKVDELMALCDRLKARLQSAQTTQLHLADTLVEAAIH